jgi:uncharacterized repeat protein (TIGR01451 family)
MTTSGTLLQLTLTSNATGTLVGYAGGPINTTAANFSFYGSSADPVTSGSLSSAAPPTVSKAFGASTVAVGGSTSVTITITNPNANALSALNFTDTLPAGLQVSSPTGLSNTCNGVAIASIGGSTIQLSGGTLAGNTSCAVGANVTGVTAGSNVNSVTVSSSAGNSNTGTATLVVLAPPGLTKSFSPPLLTYFNVTTLTFTISNPNPTVALTGVGFTDNLPGGLLVAGPAGVTTTCPSGSIGASPGGSSIVLSALTLAGGSSCTVSVNVSGFADGNITNTATPTSSNGGTGSPATATISVRRYMLYLWFFS